MWIDDDDDGILLEDMKMTLEGAKIKSGQQMIVEIQSPDGKWPRGGDKEKEPEVNKPFSDPQAAPRSLDHLPYDTSGW